MATTIDQLAAKSQANNDAAAAALDSFASGMQEVTARMKTSAQEVAEAQKASVTATGLAVQKAEKATLDQATVLGTNPDAATFMLTKIAKQYENNNARAQQFADDVAYAADPTNIVDDPLKYVKNLVLMKLNQKGQESAERAASRSYAQYQGLNEMTQETKQTQVAIAQTATADKIKADSLAAAFQFTQAADQADIESLRLGSNNVMTALKLKNDAFDIERARQASADDAVRLNLARQAAAKQNVEMDLRIAASRRAEAREKRMESKEAEAAKMELEMVGLINKAAEATGVPIAFKSVKELTMAMKSPELAEKIDTLYKVGLQSAYSSRKGPDGKLSPTLAISDSPAKTLNFVRGMGAKLSPGQQPLIKLFDAVQSDWQDTDPNAIKMKPAEYANALDQKIRTAAAAQYKNIGKVENNIYAAPPLETYLGNTEFVVGAPTLAAAMKTRAELGDKTLDFGKLTDSLVEAARKGTIPLTKIDGELKFLAQKTMAINNSLRRYEETAGLPRMTNVNVKLAMPDAPYSNRGDMLTMFGSETEYISVDLADDNKRAAYLNKLYSRTIPQVLKQQAAKKGAQK